MWTSPFLFCVILKKNKRQLLQVCELSLFLDDFNRVKLCLPGASDYIDASVMLVS